MNQLEMDSSLFPFAVQIQPNDVLLCVSSAARTMSFPPLQLVLGGGGTPVIARVPVVTAGKPLSFVAKAIKSNLELRDSRVS